MIKNGVLLAVIFLALVGSSYSCIPKGSEQIADTGKVTGMEDRLIKLLFQSRC